jgi:ABC-type Mn2+/Zn2+ transport system permease subunit
LAVESRRARIPQEAIIGICYAVASAAAILAMSKATSESEHLKDMLVGNILAVSWREVAKTAILYGIIGAFHFIFRRQFGLVLIIMAAVRPLFPIGQESSSSRREPSAVGRPHAVP